MSSPRSRRSLNSTVLRASSSSDRAWISGSSALIDGTIAARLRTFLLSPARRTFPNTLTTGHCTPPPLRHLFGRSGRRGSAGSGLSRRPPGSAARTRRRPAGSTETRDPARWCGAPWSMRTFTKVPGSSRSPVRAGEVDELALACPAREHAGSFLDGPSTTASSTRPTRARLRASADRSITTFRRSKRSATSSGGTYSSVICAARVPGRGEKMNV